MIKLIVGLGNPGEKYIKTRHNLGFSILDEYSRKKLSPKELEHFWQADKRSNSELGRINLSLLIAKPQTHMNMSGIAVQTLAQYYKIKPVEIAIVHDDLDLPLGHIKIRLGGAAAGHHGVESIINSLGSDKFVRIRLGIGTVKASSGERKRISFNAEKFVLDPFTQKESSSVKSMTKKAIEAIDILLEKGLEVAQNQYNQ